MQVKVCGTHVDFLKKTSGVKLEKEAVGIYFLATFSEAWKEEILSGFHSTLKKDRIKVWLNYSCEFNFHYVYNIAISTEGMEFDFYDQPIETGNKQTFLVLSKMQGVRVLSEKPDRWEISFSKEWQQLGYEYFVSQRFFFFQQNNISVFCVFDGLGPHVSHIVFPGKS